MRTRGRKALILVATSAAVLAVAALPVVTILRLSAVAFGVAGGLYLVAWAIYGLEVEARGLRASWWRRGEISQREIRRRVEEAIARAEAEQISLPLANRLECGGMNRCRVGMRRLT